MKPIYLGALTLLGSIWGASFIFIHVAVVSFGPIPLMWGRVAIAAVALTMLGIMTKSIPNFRHYWRQFLIVGTINAAIPFTLIAWSELTLSASLASILNSTTPLFTAMIAAVWIGETLTWRKILGVVLGIIGVAILVGGSALTLTGSLVWATLASLGAAALYGVGTVYASRNFIGLKPLETSIGQLFGATTVLLIPMLLTLPNEIPPMNAIGSLLALALVSTAFAYLLYFYLLMNVGPTRTATVTFLVPVFGTFWGVLFLGDTLTAGMLVGMAIVLSSVGLVISGRFTKSKRPPVKLATGD